MKLSSQWIRDFVDLPVDDRQLAEDLTNVGIGVEGISGEGADTVFEMEIGDEPARRDESLRRGRGRRQRFTICRSNHGGQFSAE